MKRFISILISVVTLLLASFFAGCESQGDYADFYNFTTQIHVEVYTGKLSDEVRTQIKDTLNELEDAFSISKSTSLPARFNALQQSQTITLTQMEKDVIEKAFWGYEFTQGRFNPAVYPLSTLWGFAPNFNKDNFVKPTTDQIDQILTSNILDFDSVATFTDNTLTKTVTDAKMDLGGIVKGYACDLIARILKNEGFTNGYVNVGGSSLNLLHVKSLAITHPRKEGQILKFTKELIDLSVSTSGDYERYFTDNDTRYCHIIDSNSGAPIQTGIQSVTVVCPNGMVADILSTALCLCEYSQANDTLTPLMNKIIQTLPSTKMFVVLENQDGKQLVTNTKKGEQFTLLDNDYSVVEI